MSEELKKEILNKQVDEAQLDQIAGGRGKPIRRPYKPVSKCANVSKRDDCQATVELGSWCGSNDACLIWDCSYEDCTAEDVDVKL